MVGKVYGAYTLHWLTDWLNGVFKSKALLTQQEDDKIVLREVQFSSLMLFGLKFYITP